MDRKITRTYGEIPLVTTAVVLTSLTQTLNACSARSQTIFLRDASLLAGNVAVAALAAGESNDGSSCCRGRAVDFYLLHVDSRRRECARG